jgi:uncharacterized membrane protein
MAGAALSGNWGEPRRPVRRPGAAALWAVVALGFGLRAVDLTREGLWIDEVFSLDVASRPTVAAVLTEVRADTHPPLHFLLLHGWTRLFGASDAAARSLSVLLGTLAIPVLFGVGARLAGRRAGLLAALYAALSPWQIGYSLDVRPYALVLLLTALSTWFFLGFLRRPSARDGVGWTVSTALLLETTVQDSVTPGGPSYHAGARRAPLHGRNDAEARGT